MAGTTVLKEREQHERRVPMEKIDHAGRVWHCEVDIHDRQRGHCAVPTLDGQYLPPIDIPYKYLKKQDPQKPFQMRINFQQWKSDWRERMTQVKQRMYELAQIMYPHDYGEKIQNPPPELISMLGPMPIPLDFIEACEVGNKWALGIPRADGTYYPRPKWATDEMWAQYEALRQSFWFADGSPDFAAPDPAKYADEDDETPMAPAPRSVAFADEDEDPPTKPRGPGGRFAKTA